jgi:hypothetical protein
MAAPMTFAYRHRFTADALDSRVCSVCRFTIGSITHALMHSNMSVEHAARKRLRVRCQCACVCANGVTAAKRGGPRCRDCAADRHFARPLTAREMHR